MIAASLMWLIVGGGFCLLELVTPMPFMALVMGISCFILSPTTPYLPLNLQIVLWMILSLALFWVSQSFVRPPSEAHQLDADYAFTLTEFLPGETGRVNYEGQSWAAQLDDPTIQLPPEQKVRVIDRQGTLLIVSVIHVSVTDVSVIQ
jgi:membrane protein implicated in regulation of membrane protease activity